MRTAHRRIRLAAAALALGALGVAGAGCGPADDPRAGGKPDSSDVSRPDGWKPWRTVLTGSGKDGLGADASPGEGEANSCSTDGAPEGRLRCMGSGFRGEDLSVADGTHRPHERIGEYQDFAHHDGLVLSTESDEWWGTVKALDERTGRERWRHDDQNPALTEDGVVATEKTDHRWEPGQSHDEEPPTVEPGGDILARAPETGELRWRAEVPDDADCEPMKVTERTVISCRKDAGELQPVTLHRPVGGDEDGERKLERLATVDAIPAAEGARPQFLGYDRGDLVFLPADGKPAWAQKKPDDYEKLVRVDARTGKKTTKELPDGLSTGERAHLSGGTLHFRDSAKGGRTRLTAVDARSGAKRWETRTSRKQLSAPETSEKLGEVYFADHAGRLLALDLGSGAKRWRTDEPRAADGGTDTSQMDAPSSVTRVRDVLVVSAGNTVYTVDPARPDAKPEEHRVRLEHGKGK